MERNIIIGLIITLLIIIVVGSFLIVNSENMFHKKNDLLIEDDPFINYYTRKNNHYTNEIGPCYDKPIIYLYPTTSTEVEVKLGNPEKLSCSYPKYTNGWRVLANPDGKLIDLETGRKLYSLYWEGIRTDKINLNEGFVVKGEDTAKFFEEKLAILGLNEYETEEFIVYWLPKMENNKYNFIRFATAEEINDYMPLEFSVEPDSLIRVLMQFKPLENPIQVVEQRLTSPERTGFVVVEWGGSEIN